MAGLQSSIRTLADDFVKRVLHALSTASLAELSALGDGKRRAAPVVEERAKGRGKAAKSAPGKRIRRSSDDVAKLAEAVVDYVKTAGGNVAVSDIARALQVPTGDINRPVAIALKEGKIKKQGEKRLTRYFPASGGGAAKRRGKKLGTRGAARL